MVTGAQRGAAGAPTADRPAGRSRRLALLATLLLLAAALGFTALAAWQLQRREAKLALIERTTARLAARPVALPPPADWPRVDAAAAAYTRVQARGRWRPGADTRVQAVTALGAGHWLLSPLQLDGGGTVLVNRGWVPPGSGPVPAPSGPVQLTGLLRASEPHGAFLRANDPAAGRWTSRDVAAIAAARGLGPVAPFFIDAAADPTAPAGAPVGGLTVVAFPNNHAVYALTWSALALMSLCAIVLVWREHGRPAAPSAAAARRVRPGGAAATERPGDGDAD
ncbi:SURF1 family protein [Piscinibacter sakaiensis]|uniref:SURF1-like protein n=1 Tax=Piscinibacter sakaiensis TaxID=1547922 RepID=A0A0K8NYK7_PISS1|nr:SURF1 family cytochrome oxidase biogenesis protein [Piscinibacter sakaiensis]GAP35466.1 cytochrome oxidase biogenesis protein Surf1 [Piscinibacter sakaiensis]